jgi:hypothetical protein
MVAQFPPVVEYRSAGQTSLSDDCGPKCEPATSQISFFQGRMTAATNGANDFSAHEVRAQSDSVRPLSGTNHVRLSNRFLLLGSCVGFAVAGALTRFNLLTVSTRFQIAIFWLAALVLHAFVRRTYGPRLSTLALALNGVAGTIAIIATKWWLEGLPWIFR